MNASQLYSHQNQRPQPSSVTLASIPNLDRETLSEWLIEKPNDSERAIIDVRDSDYIGGHIVGCQNIPTSTLDYKLPELVRTLKGKKTVIFHCMLSQQRGPASALRYVREREKLGLKTTGKNGDEGEQKVYILAGGFAMWQEKFGSDTRLTEGYAKDIWETQFF